VAIPGWLKRTFQRKIGIYVVHIYLRKWGNGEVAPPTTYQRINVTVNKRNLFMFFYGGKSYIYRFFIRQSSICYQHARKKPTDGSALFRPMTSGFCS